MDPLQETEAIQQFMKLLEENGRQGQAADLSALMWYMDGMNRQYEAVLTELQALKEQLSQEKRPSVKYVMQRPRAGQAGTGAGCEKGVGGSSRRDQRSGGRHPEKY